LCAGDAGGSGGPFTGPCDCHQRGLADQGSHRNNGGDGDRRRIANVSRDGHICGITHCCCDTDCGRHDRCNDRCHGRCDRNRGCDDRGNTPRRDPGHPTGDATSDRRAGDVPDLPLPWPIDRSSDPARPCHIHQRDVPDVSQASGNAHAMSV
jgi:hypothetical protein